MSLTRAQVLERTTEILTKHAKGEVDLTEKTEIVADLGIDSLGVMEALAEVEDALEVTFDDEQLQGISTLGDLVDLISRELASGE
jgi:acyl carrier protein